MSRIVTISNAQSVTRWTELICSLVYYICDCIVVVIDGFAESFG